MHDAWIDGAGAVGGELRVAVVGAADALTERLTAAVAASPAVAECRAVDPGEGRGRPLPRGGEGRGEGALPVDAAVLLPLPVADRRRLPDAGAAAALAGRLSAAGVRHLVLLSSARVHEPNAHHPGRLDEARSVPCRRGNPISARWAELETRVAEAIEGSDTVLTALRPTPVLVPGSRELFCRLLGSGRLAATVPGFDPTVQLLSPEDLAAAVRSAVERRRGGVYHLAPSSGIPLRRAVRAAGMHRLPVPTWLRGVGRWLLRPILPRPPVAELDDLRYPSTVDARKAARELGFHPRLTSAEAIRGLRGTLSGALSPGPSPGRGRHSPPSTSAQGEGRPHPPTDSSFSASLPPLPGRARRVGRERGAGGERGKGGADPVDASACDHSDHHDDFGLDVGYHRRLGRTLFRFLHDVYWRIEVQGLEQVPAEGRAVMVGVHRGFQPWDGVMTFHILASELGRHPRFLVHPTLVKFPFLTPYMTRLGGVLACAENAEWVLEREGLLGVYPEGIQGAFTFYRHAYQLGRFGRGEFVKMALRHRAPLVPFVTVGSAEIYPIFGRIDWKWWKRLSEWPFLPITPTLGLVPLPSKWHTWFLEPEHVEREYPPEAADDPAVVRAISRRVRRRMEAAIAEMLRRRKSIFYGSIFDREPDGAPASATDAVPDAVLPDAVLPDAAVRRSAPGELK